MLRDIFFFIAPLLKIRFLVPIERIEIAISNPEAETLKVGLKISVSIRFTITSNRILKRELI